MYYIQTYKWYAYKSTIPLGTGKTRTIVGLLLQLTKAVASKEKQKILVCTPSNTAVDEIVRRFAQELHSNGTIFVVVKM
jgi:superfamily I DNA and/or RNA helicase